jgi:hypothetical protein
VKSDLAEELLNHLMRWDRAEFQENVRCLLALAAYKFDEYGNFRPGDKFFESLAAWLDQMEPNDRADALDFVLKRLIFISDAEMTHLIELVYPDHIEIVLRDRVAARLGCSPYEVARIVEDPTFAALRRRSLVLGASDGARLDRLRRAAPTLSHEQFLQSDEPPVQRVAAMREKLVKALETLGLEAADTFGHVFLVDDFAGSGTTMLRDEDGEWVGKLTKLAGALGRLESEGLVEDSVDVTVILYVASEKAHCHLKEALEASPLPAWEVRVVQPLPDWVRVDRQDEAMTALCERYYDAALDDEIKGRVPLGYARCALPVVLSHNTPNNSVSLLWGDTTAEEDSLQRRALFPRYERHHRDRP